MAKLKETVTVQYPNGVYEFKLVQALKQRGVKQATFLRDLETTYNTFYRYAVGTIQRVDLETLDRWCRYLDCDITDIVTYTRK